MWMRTRKERRLSTKKTKTTKKNSKSKKTTSKSSKKATTKKNSPKNIIPVLTKETYRGLYFVISVLIVILSVLQLSLIHI